MKVLSNYERKYKIKERHRIQKLSFAEDWRTVGKVTDGKTTVSGEMYHYLFISDNGDKIMISNEKKLDL